MRMKKHSKPYVITLEYPNGVTRSTTVVASTREVAESRALKRNPAAIKVKRGAG
jgi:hypothetical protein